MGSLGLSTLARELLQVEKWGVDAPGKITPRAQPELFSLLDGLLDETGDRGEALRRHIASFLRHVVDQDPDALAPGDRELAERRLRLTRCLFQLDEDWVGKSLTERRAHLGRLLSPRSKNPDNVIRENDEPKLLARLVTLLEREAAAHEPKTVERRACASLLKELRALCVAFVREVGVHRFEPHAVPANPLPREQLLKALWRHMEIENWHAAHSWRVFTQVKTIERADGRGPRAVFEAALATRLKYSRWSERERSTLRAAHASAAGEPGPFLDWLDDTPAGQRVLNVWLAWFEAGDSGRASQDERYPGPPFPQYLAALVKLTNTVGPGRTEAINSLVAHLEADAAMTPIDRLMMVLRDKLNS